MRVYPDHCPHCKSRLEITMIVPKSPADAIKRSERLALCPNCDAPSTPPPARPV